MCMFLVHVAHETAGAARIRQSLRPLNGEGVKFPAKLGHFVPRECEGVPSRHCEERLRRSNPSIRYAELWIASLRSQ